MTSPPPDDWKDFPSGEFMTEARAHHYVFAHQLLPSLAFENPLEFMASMWSDDANERLLELWNQVGNLVMGRGDGEILASECLEVRANLVAGRPCAVVKLPPPQGVLECFYVAALLESIPTTDQSEGRVSPPALMYFTLELGWDVGRSWGSRTVLGEWRRDAHLNHGNGPSPAAIPFLEAVLAILDREEPK
jgi:hypothetical protein